MDQDKDICLFCGEKVDDDDKIECSNCKSIYHKDCFEKLKEFTPPFFFSK